MTRRFDRARDVWHPLDATETSRLIDGTGAWISGGVGIDLWLRRTTRPHGDIDVSVTRAAWPGLVAGLPAWLTLHAAVAGELSPLVDGHLDRIHHLWCHDERAGSWCLQINIEDGDDTWAYRRYPSITLPWDIAVLDVDGMRIAAPEVQLLWKSRDPAPKDDADRANVVPRLAPDRLAWLRAATDCAHPESPWATGAAADDRGAD